MQPTRIAYPLAGNVLGGDGNFVIAEWRDPGGPPGPPRFIAPPHLHRNDDEAWYVLEGTLCVRLGEEVVQVPSGSSVMVPRGTVHTYWNPAETPCRYLLIMTANVYALIRDIHAMSERTPAALKVVFEKHDSELA